MRAPFASRTLLILAPALAFIAGPLACAQAVRISGGDATSGSGGGGGESGGAGGSMDAGVDAPPGPCLTAGDCTAFTDTCNTGTCINGKCEKLPANELSACDDGKQCTQGDSCQKGVCTGGAKKFCPSSSSCAVGDCDVATDTCVEIPGNNGAPCVDNDPCTQSGTCGNGVCQPGPPVDCSFLDGTCSQGVCDPQLGCVTAPLNDGTSCDDGFFCTVNDVCSAGTCAGVPNTCAAPGDVCLIGTCNEVSNTCVAVPGNNGGACDDGSSCTTGETCSNGICGGGAPTNNGGACDDKSACTTGDVCNNGVCSGAAVVACQSNDGCCPAGCDFNTDSDCKLLNVAVMGGDFYTDTLRAYLAGQPFIQSAVTNNLCDVATLSQFDVVILYGNMACFDANAFNTYVQNGGGLIGTPWIFGNNQGLTSLPVSGSSITTNFNAPLNVQVTDANDVLLTGVNFANGDPVGWEEWSFSLNPGATSSVIWNNDPTRIAVAKWGFGSGRAVYLDFHYITSDCALAIDYNWGKQLVYNATLWAGKAL